MGDANGFSEPARSPTLEGVLFTTQADKLPWLFQFAPQRGILTRMDAQAESCR